MKPHHILTIAAIAVGLLVAGCNKDGSVDTSKVESTFASADATAKSEVDKIVTSLKSADYAAALEPLKKLAADVRLTPEQQQSLKDLLAQVQAKISEAAAAAAAQATDAMKKVQEGAADATDKAREATGKALEDLGNKIKP
jgi:hypothetical protein